MAKRQLEWIVFFALKLSSELFEHFGIQFSGKLKKNMENKLFSS